RKTSSACGRRAFSASSRAWASSARCLAPEARPTHMCSAWVSCERWSRQEPSCARRSVCWLSRRWRVSRAVVRRARGLDARLDAAQLRVLGLELVRGPADLGAVPVALGRGVAAAQIPEELLLELQVGMVFLVARGDLRLRVELLQLGRELEADVVDARQVLAR